MRTEHRYVLSMGAPVDLVTEYDEVGALLAVATVSPIDREITEGEYRTLLIEREAERQERQKVRYAEQAVVATERRTHQDSARSKLLALGLTEDEVAAITSGG